MTGDLGAFDERAPLDALAGAELAALADAQSTLVELIVGDEPLDDVLRVLVAQLDEQWPGAVFALWPVDGLDPIVLGTDVDAELVDALADLSAIDVDDERVGDPVRAEASSATVWAVVIPVPWSETPALLATSLSDPDRAAELDSASRTLLMRHARFAKLAIDRHNSELTLQRLIAKERRSIAGVIHDDPVQALTAVSLRLQRLARHVDDEGQAILADTRTAVTQAVDRMRRLITEFHPPTLDDEGLEPAIEEYCDEVLEPLGIGCELDIDLHDEPTAGSASLAYRLITEALWNAAKHASPTRVTVSLRGEHGAIECQVDDDGTGFDVAQVRRRAGHLGLSACRQLARRASGSWEIESAPGEGTAVRFSLPGTVAVELSDLDD